MERILLQREHTLSTFGQLVSMMFFFLVFSLFAKQVFREARALHLQIFPSFHHVRHHHRLPYHSRHNP